LPINRIPFRRPADAFLDALAVFLVSDGKVAVELDAMLPGIMLIKANAFIFAAYPFLPCHDCPLCGSPHKSGERLLLSYNIK
jgi:hypothetical protein